MNMSFASYIRVDQLSVDSPTRNPRKIFIRALPQGSGAITELQGETVLTTKTEWSFCYVDMRPVVISVSLIDQGKENSFVSLILMIPLTWFMPNTVVTDTFPMTTSTGASTNCKITLSVHLSHNGALPFMAPPGNLLVIPAWKNSVGHPGYQTPNYYPQNPNPPSLIPMERPSPYPAQYGYQDNGAYRNNNQPKVQQYAPPPQPPLKHNPQNTQQIQGYQNRPQQHQENTQQYAQNTQQYNEKFQQPGENTHQQGGKPQHNPHAPQRYSDRPQQYNQSPQQYIQKPQQHNEQPQQYSEKPQDMANEINDILLSSPLPKSFEPENIDFEFHYPSAPSLKQDFTLPISNTPPKKQDSAPPVSKTPPNVPSRPAPPPISPPPKVLKNTMPSRPTPPAPPEPQPKPIDQPPQENLTQQSRTDFAPQTPVPSPGAVPAPISIFDEPFLPEYPDD